MSAWPEAVWIVQQMQDRFQTIGKIDSYEALLNNLNIQLDNLQDKFNTQKQNLSNIKEMVIPDVSETMPIIKQGKIWFVVSDN